ncbi:cytochrome d ubiquinol oxidase subunit II [Streptomyces sp. 891-h]|uniref:cytochrome d ubiquinol oxidase subunit II n=1 Tax=Streptomyces sp. 891-h TaxID=2720714 RepID=UPI001FAA39AD|nr:cytochrome d ubiquinol oxidase subunit II [Streptomyces sp. 891-h]UNZ16122.1 cytochrome d ubiquinol oxidase subunit II [Streptomyces sp. 891-h]
MQTAWLLILGALLSGYFVLGGYDYGVQMVRGLLAADERERRVSLNALGPLFFGNEVWLVAFAGVLFGAFPFLEGTLLSGLYPLILVLLLGLVVGKAGVQLRGRASGPTARRCWDVLIALGGLLPATSWGLVVGVLLTGVPRGADGSFTVRFGVLADPFVLVCALTTVVLFLAHGSVFLTLRTTGALAARAARAARGLLAATAACALTGALLAAAGDASALVNAGAAQLLAALLFLALAAGWPALARRRNGWAFTATSLAAAVPVALVGAGSYPYVLVSTVDERFGMTVHEAAADGATLTVLSAFGVVLIPLMVAYQAWSWWLFGGRVRAGSPGYL